MINFAVIGCGLMGKEFASAVGRWLHLSGLNFKPRIIAVCDLNDDAMKWFTDNLDTIKYTTNDYQEILQDNEVDAVYCAVPHNLHKKFYVDIINAGKHLLGEKPFGIDQEANQEIMNAIQNNPDVLVRSSSEIPYYPGSYEVFHKVKSDDLGQIMEVEAGFWHSSDLNPEKPINWKRIQKTNGEYGCMGDLGLHVLHLPLRFGWDLKLLGASLSNIMKERPNQNGEMQECDTWDNAVLLCEGSSEGNSFPVTVSTKRIAPGHANTWFIKVYGTKGSIEYSTQNPKLLRVMEYEPGGKQVWKVEDVPHQSAYESITGGIFEFGFSDSILQMWAAFCEELIYGKENMSQPLYCATPEEAQKSHALFTDALNYYKSEVNS